MCLGAGTSGMGLQAGAALKAASGDHWLCCRMLGPAWMHTAYAGMGARIVRGSRVRM